MFFYTEPQYLFISFPFRGQNWNPLLVRWRCSYDWGFPQWRLAHLHSVRISGHVTEIRARSNSRGSSIHSLSGTPRYRFTCSYNSNIISSTYDTNLQVFQVSKKYWLRDRHIIKISEAFIRLHWFFRESAWVSLQCWPARLTSTAAKPKTPTPVSPSSPGKPSSRLFARLRRWSLAWRIKLSPDSVHLLDK